MTPATKTCIACGWCLPAAGYLPSPYRPDGLTDTCRRCVLARARAEQADRDRRRSLPRSKLRQAIKPCAGARP
jgi:hypothetical protein